MQRSRERADYEDRHGVPADPNDALNEREFETFAVSLVFSVSLTLLSVYLIGRMILRIYTI